MRIRVIAFGMIIFIAVIALVALGIILLARILYRRHLDRVVAGKERGVHTNRVEPNSVAKIVFAVAAAIWMVLSMVCLSIYLSVINTRIEDMKNDLSNQISMMDGSIAMLREELKEAKSMLSSSEYEFKAIDAEKKTMDIEFRVVPKKIDANATVTVSWGPYSTEMKQVGGTYRGTMTTELFKRVSEDPVITIQSGDVKETEILQGTLSNSPADNYFKDPYVWYDDRRVTWLESGTAVQIDGHAEYFNKGMLPVEGLKITSGAIVIRSGSTELKRVPVDVNGTETTIDLSGEYSFVTDSMEMLIELTTDAGWKIESPFERIELDGRNSVAEIGYVEVLDKDGKLLFSTGRDY